MKRPPRGGSGAFVPASSIPPAAAASLDRLGYILLPGVADPPRLAVLRDAFERLAPRAEAGRRGTGTRHVELPPDDPPLESVREEPRVLAAARHVLGRPFRLFQMGGRDPLPGYGRQGLHTDWLPRLPGDPFSLVTAIWLLDDFTDSNGATRLIPSSHAWPRPLPKPMTEPVARHPAEIRIAAAAGSVLFLNGHIWHSGTRNDSTGTRRVLQVQYVARDAAGAGLLLHGNIETHPMP